MMTNAEAIETLRANYPDACYEQLRCAVDMAINALTAQPEKAQLSEEDATSDCISRKDAIRIVDGIDTWQAGWRGDAIESIKALPSAQPETHEKRTETHACDLIDRQAAIDAILAVTGNSSVRELYEHVQEHGLSEMWSGGVNAAIDIIIAVPSAQPERKKGEWIDYTEDGYVECPFCHSATNCDGNKDELHFCFSCGADMRGE